MSLAIAAVPSQRGITVEAVATNGQRAELPLSKLSQDGLPSKRARVDVSGEMGTWATADFAEYSAGLGVVLPSWATPRHQVFCHQLADGMTAYVPALALMRAFFWPNAEVLPAAFTSHNVDQFAYVNYGSEPPVVTVMPGLNYFRAFDAREGNDRYLKWLQGSRSARACCQAVELQAMSGWLGLKLPQGTFELTLVGHKGASAFYATAVELNSVKVLAEDNISGQDEMFYLHRSPTTSAMRRAEGLDTDITVDEWQALQPLLLTREFEAGPDVLRLMLKRLANGHWDRAEPGVVCKSGQALRTWTTSTTLDDVLDRLEAIRRGSFPTDARRLNELRAGAQVKADPHEPGTKVVRLFLDAEFVDKKDDVQLLSIGLAGDDGEFYAEQDRASLGKLNAGKFIDTEVLPQLGRGIGLAGSPCGIAKALVTWLNNFDADRIDVHYDFNLDYTLLEHVLMLVPGQLVPQLEPVHVAYLLEDADGIDAALRSWESSKASRNIQRHHALADAIALRARFLAVHANPAARG